jgi:hypothetical protein
VYLSIILDGMPQRLQLSLFAVHFPTRGHDLLAKITGSCIAVKCVRLVAMSAECQNVDDCIHIPHLK